MRDPFFRGGEASGGNANLKIRDESKDGVKSAMDLATITGLLLGLTIIIGSLIAGHVSLQTVFQPEAILIVFGGTLTALLVNFSWAEIGAAFASLRYAFYEEEFTPEDVVDTISDAAVYIRTKGLLAVQPLLSHVDLPFLQKALQMVVDNQPLEHIRSQLTTELEVAFRHASKTAKVFEMAGGFAPTMGIIGAILGLIHVMGNLASPQQLGQGVAAAFMATLYGVGMANLALLPLAGKLKERAKQDWFIKSIVLQGILEIREGKNPTLIREVLEAYLKVEAPYARRMPDQDFEVTPAFQHQPDELAYAYANPYHDTAEVY